MAHWRVVSGAPDSSIARALLPQNEARIQAGKGPLGNLNQWIYQNSDMLDDITQGNDRISRSGFPVPLGFDCEEGACRVLIVGAVRRGCVLTVHLSSPRAVWLPLRL